ncbi:MAG: hypothetical protein ACR2MO_02900 [Acidimicrobiales bacterium]
MTGSSRREDGEAVSFFRRQLVLAAVAGGVVLVAVVVVGAVMAAGSGLGHAALRPSADGSGVTAVSPLAESSRTAVWVAGAALVAVAAVLALAVAHVCRVARFAVSNRAGGDTFPNDAASPDAAQEAC